MHFSGNQHTPCQTLFGLSTVATSPDGKPRGGDAAATALLQQKVLPSPACEPALARGHLSTSNLTDNNKLYSI